MLNYQVIVDDWVGSDGCLKRDDVVKYLDRLVAGYDEYVCLVAGVLRIAASVFDQATRYGQDPLVSFSNAFKNNIKNAIDSNYDNIDDTDLVKYMFGLLGVNGYSVTSIPPSLDVLSKDERVLFMLMVYARDINRDCVYTFCDKICDVVIPVMDCGSDDSYDYEVNSDRGQSDDSVSVEDSEGDYIVEGAPLIFSDVSENGDVNVISPYFVSYLGLGALKSYRSKKILREFVSDVFGTWSGFDYDTLIDSGDPTALQCSFALDYYYSRLRCVIDDSLSMDDFWDFMLYACDSGFPEDLLHHVQVLSRVGCDVVISQNQYIKYFHNYVSNCSRVNNLYYIDRLGLDFKALSDAEKNKWLYRITSLTHCEVLNIFNRLVSVCRGEQCDLTNIEWYFRSELQDSSSVRRLLSYVVNWLDGSVNFNCCPNRSYLSLFCRGRVEGWVNDFSVPVSDYIMTDYAYAMVKELLLIGNRIGNDFSRLPNELRLIILRYVVDYFGEYRLFIGDRFSVAGGYKMLCPGSDYGKSLPLVMLDVFDLGNVSVYDFRSNRINMLRDYTKTSCKYRDDTYVFVGDNECTFEGCDLECGGMMTRNAMCDNIGETCSVCDRVYRLGPSNVAYGGD
jgi:hypothetical protein